MATVSVVIATRDRPTLAAGAVRNALAQLPPPDEVVVVDDGSREPLRLPADTDPCGRVRLLRLERAVGPGPARNTGVASSTGELVAFLDDDDRWRPGKLAQDAFVLQRSSARVAAVECGYELWAGGRLVRVYVPDPRRDLRHDLLTAPLLQPSTVMVRRAAFDALGGFSSDWHGRCEDWELWLRLADAYEVTALPQVAVDRWRSTAAPRQELEGFRWLRGVVRWRVAQLPADERARVEAYELLLDGIYLARCGRRRDARAALVRAWRRDPRTPRPLLQLIRTGVGERGWAVLREVIRPDVQRLGARRRRGPLAPPA